MDVCTGLEDVATDIFYPTWIVAYPVDWASTTLGIYEIFMILVVHVFMFLFSL
jgi:hypothetical protein